MTRTNGALRLVPTGERLAPADVAIFLLVLAVGIAVKRYYSSSSAEDLEFVLHPTAALVGFVFGAPFHEARAGWVSEELRTIIAPACAGLNYLVIAFSTLTFAFVRRLDDASDKLGWTLASAAAAYAATLLVNAGRIALGIALKLHHATLGWSAETVHRVEGVVVYLGSLWMLVFAADALLVKIVQRTHQHSPARRIR